MNWQKLIRQFLICAAILNILGYFIVGYFSHFFYAGQQNVVYDFYNAFMPAVRRYSSDPALLYKAISPDWPFRAFPEVIYYFMPYYFLPPQYDLNLLICSAVILVLNFACCVLITKISSLEEFKEMKNSLTIFIIPLSIGLYLLTPAHFVEYIHGQVNVITNTFMLLSIYNVLQKKEKIGFFFLGCAGVFKITIFLLLPFFLFNDIKTNFLKKAITRLGGFILPFVPSIIMLLLNPAYIQDFISVNISATENLNSVFEIGNCSLSKFLATVFNINIVVSFLVIAAVIYLISGYVLMKYRFNVIERYMLGIFSMILIMPDFYGVHFLFIWGILMLWCMIKPRFLGWKYRFAFFIITFSFFGWVVNPFSALVITAFYIAYIIDLVKKDDRVHKPLVLKFLQT
jgi:hypothetical protein